MTNEIPHDDGAETEVSCWLSVPPDPALAGVTAAWQAILRARHPEFTGLVVGLIDGGANGAACSDERSGPDVRSHNGASDPVLRLLDAA